jgi:hypothetical protein
MKNTQECDVNQQKDTNYRRYLHKTIAEKETTRKNSN